MKIMRLLDRIDKKIKIYETGVDNSTLTKIYIKKTAEKSIKFYVYHIKL